MYIRKEKGIAILSMLIMSLVIMLMVVGSYRIILNNQKEVLIHESRNESMINNDNLGILVSDAILSKLTNSDWDNIKNKNYSFLNTVKSLNREINVVGAEFKDDHLFIEIKQQGRYSNHQVSELVLKISPPIPQQVNVVRPYATGVLGCSYVRMAGSGMVDSFDSRIDGYGASFFDSNGELQQNKLRENVTVQTLYADSTFTMTGNSPIYGDVVHVGNSMTTSGSAPVYGDIYTQGDLTMGGRSFGDIYSKGDVSFTTSSNAQGHVYSEGNVHVDSTGNPPQHITANGTIQYPSWWQWDNNRMNMVNNQYTQNASVAIDSLLTDEECDVVGIRDKNGDLSDEFDMKGDRLDDYLDSKNYFENNNTFSLRGPGGNNSQLTIGQSGQSTTLYIDKDLTTQGNLNVINIEGHVDIVVRGDLTINNNTQVVIQPNSSVRFIVEGVSRFNGGSNVLGQGPFVRDVNGQLRPAVEIVSGYEGGVGVFMAGSNDSIASVYAPYTEARITGSGDIYGSVRADKLNILGAGGIHYDESLEDVSFPGGMSNSPPQSFRIKTWNHSK